jgi:hypothetical protein
MGEGLGGSDTAQLVNDGLMDAVEVCPSRFVWDLVVPKPENAIALALQKPASLGFSRR